MRAALTFDQFMTEFRKIEDRFGRILKGSQRDVYYDYWMDISLKAYPKLVRDIVKTARSFPTPDDLLQSYHIWTKSHGHEVDDGIVHSDCKYCHSKGYFIFTRPYIDKVYPYEYVAGCKHCENAKFSQYVPLGDKKVLEERNYKVIYPMPPSDKKVTKQDIKKMIASVLKPFPEDEEKDETERVEELKKQAGVINCDSEKLLNNNQRLIGEQNANPETGRSAHN